MRLEARFSLIWGPSSVGRDVCQNPRMADWMDEREKAHQRQQESQNREADLQLHRYKILEAKSRPLLDALAAQVGKDVERYNDKVGSDASRRVQFFANPSGGFKLERPHFPSASLHCNLPHGATAIIADYAFTLNHESGTHTWVVPFPLGVDSGDNLMIGKPDGSGVKFANLADVSKALIERVLYPS
jgi:hypothetical protein